MRGSPIWRSFRDRVGDTLKINGSVAELHAFDPFLRPHTNEVAAVWCEFSGPAIVLGSRQTAMQLDATLCAQQGLAIVKRRSGGGAVILRPDEVIWIDLIVPAGTVGIPEDVRGSMIWAGQGWVEALRPFVAGDLTVWCEGMAESEWSELVCFAGLGPGEVLLDGKKLVGLSQRRTRFGLRIQGLVHRVAPSQQDSSLFAEPHPKSDLPSVATFNGPLGGEQIAQRLVGALTSG